jgi:hypothetical protein
MPQENNISLKESALSGRYLRVLRKFVVYEARPVQAGITNQTVELIGRNLGNQGFCGCCGKQLGWNKGKDGENNLLELVLMDNSRGTIKKRRINAAISGSYGELFEAGILIAPPHT